MDGDNLDVNKNLETGDGQTQNPQEQLEKAIRILAEVIEELAAK